MNAAQRLFALSAAGLAALLIVWWLGRDVDRPPSAVATPTAAAASPASPSPSVSPSGAAVPSGYRLAGVAVGGATAYAAIEPPGAGTSLYRLNDEVPGLGKIVRIGGEKVVVRTATGEFEMWVAPAPTPSLTATRRLTPRVTPTRVPSAPAPAASPFRGSSPSSEPGRPAS